jgi:hypothetical protein
VASYLFPAGGQRGTTVKVRVGGLFLHKACSWELLGPGVEASKQLRRMPTLWFEGPMLPLPASQQAEDYPRDLSGTVRIAADAPLGPRRGRLWTSEGAASGLTFVVGELPEVVEQEIDGDPVPVEVKLPVTINGRIFPRENIDIWSFAAKRGQAIACEVHAARLGSPLDSRLEVRDPEGKVIAENDDTFGTDSLVCFTAPVDGKYQVRIHDVNRRGGQNYVYRLTVTAGPYIHGVYPLGGRRGSKVRFTVRGHGVGREPIEVALPGMKPGIWEHRFSCAGNKSNPVRIDVDDLPEYLEAEPNDTLAQAQKITLPAVVNGRIDRPGDIDHWSFSLRKGESLALALRARLLGSSLQGVIELCDGAGKQLARAEASGNQLDPTLAFTAPADGTYCVRVRDRFRTRGGPGFAYRLRLAVSVPGFRLRLAADALTLERGKQARLRVNVERQGGFNGPMTLAVEGLPAGVKVTGTTLGAGQSGADLVFRTEDLPRINGSRLTIRGTASLSGRTVTETATLPANGPLATTMPETDSVLLAVALKAPFKIKGTYDLRLAPRGTLFRKHYKIDRGGYSGPLVVSLADRQARHLQGVTGPTLTIPAGVTEFDYPVYLPPWMETGRTSRSCIMVTGVIKEGDVEHEVSVTSTEQNDQIIAVVETGVLGIEVDRSSITARPGRDVVLNVKVRRGKGLEKPVKLELVRPDHMRGISAVPVEVPSGKTDAKLTVRFARDKLGPFNMAALVRATLTDTSGPIVAETKLEIVVDD